MRALIGVLVCAALAGGASAQGIMGDVLSGKLINPEVGVFAWYDLTDATTGKTLFLRQAIVGEEKVKRKPGYWVETEIRPQVGFPSVYKMLLTGPAADPANVHKIIIKEGESAPQEVPVEGMAGAQNPEPASRESLGIEKVATATGEMDAEHIVYTVEGDKIDLWINDAVRPMGIVRMKSPEGELVLRSHGTGGPDAQSALDKRDATPRAEGKGVTVRVEGSGKGGDKAQTNFNKKKSP